MSNYRYSADLLTDLLFRCSEPTDASSDFQEAALRYLNRAYQSLCMGGAELDPSIQEDWWWLRKSPPGVLTLYPVKTTGTVSVTNANTGATFSTDPGSVAGWFLSVTDAPGDIFRISSIAAGVAVLDSVYTGATNPTANYRLMKLEYDVASDVLRLISPMRAYRSDYRYEILGVDLSAMDRDDPLGLVEPGLPDRFAMVDENTLRFNRAGGTASTDLIRVEYDYIARPDDLTNSASEEPVVPRQWRKILSDWAAWWLFVDKNDDRADAMGLAAKNTLRAMALENKHRLGSVGRGAIGRIVPRQDQYDRQRGPLRTSSGLILGG